MKRDNAKDSLGSFDERRVVISPRLDNDSSFEQTSKAEAGARSAVRHDVSSSASSSCPSRVSRPFISRPSALAAGCRDLDETAITTEIVNKFVCLGRLSRSRKVSRFPVV